MGRRQTILLGLALLATAPVFSGCRSQSPEASAQPYGEALDGARVEPFAPGSPEFVCLLFVDTECPIANAFSPEIGRIAKEYGARGVEFYLVYADSDRSADDVAEHRAAFGLELPGLLDPAHSLVEKSGATVTPEAALLRSGELVYRGRIDDRYFDYGKQRVEPTRRDLRLALEAALAGREPELAVTEAIGCFIPEPPEEDRP